MKSPLLIAWNVVLTVIVVALLVIAFGKGKKPESAAISENPATHHPTDSSDAVSIAIIDIDSLQNNYVLYSNKKKELEAKQQQMENTINVKMKELQTDYNNAQKASATMTQQQLQETEEKLQKQQADIQQLQNQLSTDLQNQMDKFNKELKDSLDSFIKIYNADQKYTVILSIVDGGQVLYADHQYNITTDAIKGMNGSLKK